jgi:hypothetical protein
MALGRAAATQSPSLTEIKAGPVRFKHGPRGVRKEMKMPVSAVN